MAACVWSSMLGVGHKAENLALWKKVPIPEKQNLDGLTQGKSGRIF
jgi:hypothetical protein